MPPARWCTSNQSNPAQWHSSHPSRQPDKIVRHASPACSRSSSCSAVVYFQKPISASPHKQTEPEPSLPLVSPNRLPGPGADPRQPRPVSSKNIPPELSRTLHNQSDVQWRLAVEGQNLLLFAGCARPLTHKTSTATRRQQPETTRPWTCLTRPFSIMYARVMDILLHLVARPI